MAFTSFLFYLFASILTVSALRVVASSNPVSSALFLVLAFFNAAAIWLLLKAEFLAILLVLVYVGAVMVLFLFVVMMVDIDADLRSGFKRFAPVSIMVGGAIIAETALLLWRSYGAIRAPVNDAAIVQAAPVNGAYSNTRTIGKLIYTDYIFAFEIAGLVLLVAIIAALALTLRRAKNRKSIDPAQQVRVHREDRVRIVKMRAESKAQPLEPIRNRHERVPDKEERV